MTFDGDVTLYEDGQTLLEDSPIIPCILKLLQLGIKVSVITAAGYTEAARYSERLYGLLHAIRTFSVIQNIQKNFIVVGGECNYLLCFDEENNDMLRMIPRSEWLLDEMLTWSEKDIRKLLDVAEGALKDCINRLELEARIVRKERAVGMVHETPGARFLKEQLEETVLTTQKTLVGSILQRLDIVLTAV